MPEKTDFSNNVVLTNGEAFPTGFAFMNISPDVFSPDLVQSFYIHYQPLP
jgi:hypothetical protein